MKERVKIIGEVLKPFNQYVIGDSVIFDSRIYKGLRDKGFVTFGEIHSDTYVKLRFETIDVLKTDESPVISFALPTYNNSDIIWLQLESLCRQIDAPKWELIISEEESDKYFGVDGIEKFKERLAGANCVSIKYISVTKKIPLSKKWQIIAQNIYETSLGMILGASDDYSHETRIQETYDGFIDGFEWIEWKSVMMYNILDQTASIFCNPKENNGVFMGISKNKVQVLAKTSPKNYPVKGVDGWVRKNVGQCKILVKTEMPKAVGTDGYNIISLGRRKLYGSELLKSADPDVVFNIFPDEIKERLKSMRNANS